MRYVDEYRDPAAARALLARIRARARRPRVLMEVCGGQTHALLRHGLDELLAPEVTLVHGPGCPVCVTPAETLDAAAALARRPRTMLVTYGDMLRVPGRAGDLLQARAEGGDVRVAYSPLDAVALARRHPGTEVAFLAVGFETTAPANAMAVEVAAREGLRNFSLLSAHALVPPALELVLADPDRRVEGLVGPGHVCAVAGSAAYVALATRHHVPVVIGGFEPVDLLQAVALLVDQLEDGRAEVENPYARCAPAAGNLEAQRLVERVFERCDRDWRGLGVIPGSGLRLRPAYARFDAARRFDLPAQGGGEDARCLGGLVLRGRARPSECPSFGTRCTPEAPLGALMVSAEGACSAYHRYRAGGVASC